MKLFQISMLAIAVSCSSIPKGSNEMGRKIKEDKEKNQLKKSRREQGEVNGKYLTIYAHPRVLGENVLLKEAIFYTPIKVKSKGWKEILEKEKK